MNLPRTKIEIFSAVKQLSTPQENWNPDSGLKVLSPSSQVVRGPENFRQCSKICHHDFFDESQKMIIRQSQWCPLLFFLPPFFSFSFSLELQSRLSRSYSDSLVSSKLSLPFSILSFLFVQKFLSF